MSSMITKSAIFSEDRSYRYALSRTWDRTKPFVLFVGLNPSTADENNDDPTIRRCINYAKSWGYGGLLMGNIFAFRATLPTDMKKATDPIGPENDKWLRKLSNASKITIGAWGNDGSFLNRSGDIFSILPKIYCLKVNSSGEPSHPLYLKSSLKPIVLNNGK